MSIKIDAFWFFKQIMPHFRTQSDVSQLVLMHLCDTLRYVYPAWQKEV